MIVAVGVEYLGSRYCGWQRQSNAPSVQTLVENAFSLVADHPIQVFCAGRTDTGVHATGQVVHFETAVERPEKAWVLGGNAHLPNDIAVQWACNVPQDFHARFSAVSRQYHYVIANTPSRLGVFGQHFTWIRKRLDEKAMHQAAQSLIGEQNFSTFQAASCQSPTPNRYIFHVGVSRFNDFVVIDITANAFLHHMVRNIAGSLIEIGLGRRPKEWISELIDLRDRCLAAPTASPNGLYLVRVNYPTVYKLPNPRNYFVWDPNNSTD